MSADMNALECVSSPALAPEFGAAAPEDAAAARRVGIGDLSH